MKKSYFIFFFLFLFLSITLFSVNPNISQNNSCTLHNDYLKVELFTDGENVGFIKSVKLANFDQSLISNHKFLISGSSLISEIQETSDNSISFISYGHELEVLTKYTLENNNIFISTTIINLSNKTKKSQLVEIIDYSDTFPFFSNTKLMNNHVFLLQQDYGGFGYLPLDKPSFDRIIPGNNMISNISILTLNSNEKVTFNRVIKVEKSIADIEKEYYEMHGIAFQTFGKKIQLNNGKSSQGIRVVLEDKLKKIRSVQIVDENEMALFFIPSNDDYQIKVDFGNLKTESMSLLNSDYIILDVPENYFFYQPLLTNKSENGITVNFRTFIPARAEIEVYLENNPNDILQTYDLIPMEYHHVSLQGLKPGGIYNYTIRVDDTYSNSLESETKSFQIKPYDEEIKSFNFLVYGDTQIYDDLHTYVVNRIINDNSDILSFAFVVKPGDHTEEGSSEKSWANFFESAYPIGSQVPYYTALGNHERNNELYYRAFELPCGDGDYSKRWYSFNYGNSHFIILDSNILENTSLFQEQVKWLENDLKNNQDSAFIFVAFHHPFWTTATEYGPMDENSPDGHYNTKYWLPLFKEYGVDVVINGHIHAYERYYKDGIMFITTGGGGAKLNTDHSAEPLAWHIKHVLGKLHYINFEVTEDSVKATVIAVAEIINPLFPNEYNEINEIIDEFYIH